MQIIPKIIHQTYFTRNLSAPLQRNVDQLKSMNPDYTYLFYDDDDIIHFIKDNYSKDVLTLYNMINPSYGAARADLFRYLLMFKMGGVYLDIKSCTSRPLNETIKANDKFLLSHWVTRDWAEILNNKNGEFQQWHIIAEPGHPFLSAVLVRVFNNIATYNIDIHGVGIQATLRTTGPLAYSKAINSIIEQHDKRCVANESMLGLLYYNIETPLAAESIHYSHQEGPLIL